MIKKILAILLGLLISCTLLVSAADVIISFGEDGAITQAGSELPIQIYIEKGVTLQKLSFKSNSSVIEAMTNYYLKKAGFELGKTYDETINITYPVAIPEYFPSDQATLEIEMQYKTPEGRIVSQEKSPEIIIKSESKLSNIAHSITKNMPPDVFYALFNRYKEEQEPIEKEVTKEDLFEMKPEDIGLSKEDIKNNKFTLTKIASEEKTETIPVEEIDNAIELLPPKLQEYYKKLKDKQQIAVTKTLHSYKITSEDTNKQSFISKIVLSLNINTAVTDLEIIEEISKDTAAHVNEITFLSQPIILEKDPIVKWNFQYAEKNEPVEMGYIINKKVESLDTTTITGGNEASYTSRFIIFLLNGGWIIIISGIVVILFIIPSLAYVKKRKKRINQYTKNEKAK